MFSQNKNKRPKTCEEPTHDFPQQHPKKKRSNDYLTWSGNHHQFTDLVVDVIFSFLPMRDKLVLRATCSSFYAVSLQVAHLSFLFRDLPALISNWSDEHDEQYSCFLKHWIPSIARAKHHTQMLLSDQLDSTVLNECSNIVKNCIKEGINERFLRVQSLDVAEIGPGWKFLKSVIDLYPDITNKPEEYLTFFVLSDTLDEKQQLLMLYRTESVHLAKVLEINASICCLLIDRTSYSDLVIPNLKKIWQQGVKLSDEEVVQVILALCGITWKQDIQFSINNTFRFRAAIPFFLYGDRDFSPSINTIIRGKAITRFLGLLGDDSLWADFSLLNTLNTCMQGQFYSNQRSRIDTIYNVMANGYYASKEFNNLLEATTCRIESVVGSGTEYCRYSESSFSIKSSFKYRSTLDDKLLQFTLEAYSISEKELFNLNICLGNDLNLKRFVLGFRCYESGVIPLIQSSEITERAYILDRIRSLMDLEALDNHLLIQYLLGVLLCVEIRSFRNGIRFRSRSRSRFK